MPPGRFAWRVMLSVVVALAAVSAVFSVGSARSAGEAAGLIAFVRGDGIYVMQADGSGVRRLRQLDPVSGANGLAWSPDGRKLAFVTAGHGNRLWLLDADGNNLRGIVLRAGQAASPTWSPDGRQIAFTGLRDGGQDIWVMNADGSNQRRLTITPRLWVAEVAWSPAGGRIAFIDNRDDLYLADTDGSHLRKLASGRWLDGLDWSPDGQRIAFTREPTPDDDPWLQRTREIYVINVSDRSTVRLTRNNVADRTPTWSPHGDKIAFVRSGASTAAAAAGIYVMNADGTQPTRLTHTQQQAGWSPAWQRASASAAGGGGVTAATTRSQDLLGDVTIRGGLDLRSVAVSHTATTVTFRLTVAKSSSLGANDGIGLLIDVPPAGPWQTPTT